MRKFAALSAFVCLVGLAAASSASALTLIYSEDRGGPAYHSKPERLRYVGNGVNVFKNIECTDWGSRKAIGEGKIRACAGAPECYVAPALLKARRLRPSRVDGDPARYYTRLRVVLPQNKFTYPLPGPHPGPQTDRR